MSVTMKCPCGNVIQCDFRSGHKTMNGVVKMTIYVIQCDRCKELLVIGDRAKMVARLEDKGSSGSGKQ